MSELERECQEVIGSEKLKTVMDEVDLLQVDREAVLAIIKKRAYSLRGFALLDSASKAQVDEALENLRQAIDRFKAVLQRSPWSTSVGLTAPDDFVNRCAGGLEREFDRVTAPGQPGHCLTLSMVNLGFVSKTGGRPKTGIDKHLRPLQELGMSRSQAKFLLVVAGLDSH